MIGGSIHPGYPDLMASNDVVETTVFIPAPVGKNKGRT